MRTSRFLTVAAITVLLTTTAATASAGSWQFDPSFADDGLLRLTEPANSSVLDIGVVNGRVYAAGASDADAGVSFFVMRRLTDGSADNSFGEQGIASVDLACDTSSVDFEVLPDGSSLASCQSRKVLTVLRWTEDGVLDTSFSGDGIRALALTAPTTFPYSADTGVAIDSQGRILVGAMAESNDGSNSRIYRMLPSGALDNNFSSDGVRSLDLYDVDWVDDLAVDSADRVLVASDNATCPDTSGNDCYQRAGARLVRLDSHGALDQSFSGDGVVGFGIRTYDIKFSYGIEIGVDADNVITAALSGGSNAIGSARILADGVLDPEYGVRGVVGLTCKCFIGAAQVVNGRVVMAASTSHFEQTLVTMISRSGNHIQQGEIDLMPQAHYEFVGAVALDGNDIFLGWDNTKTAFIAKIG